MIDHDDLIRRAVTIRLSRVPAASIFDARVEDWYILGDHKPRYPVPAIKISTDFVKTEDDGPNEFSIIMWNIILCPSCQDHYVDRLACLWDFNIQRCKFFFLKVGAYTNRRQVKEGIEAYNEINEHKAVLH